MPSTKKTGQSASVSRSRSTRHTQPTSTRTTRPPIRSNRSARDSVKVNTKDNNQTSSAGKSLLGGVMNWASKAYGSLTGSDDKKGITDDKQADPLKLDQGQMLKQGGQNDAGKTRRLQEILRDGGNKDLKVDGKFGPKTRAAVEAFQKKNSLNPDGIVGPKTLKALNSSQPDSKSTPERQPRFQLETGQTLGRDRKPDAARTTQLQKMLNKRGARLDPDGKFGPKTQRAVREFQRKHNLNPDGVVGPKTMAALNGEKPAVGDKNGADRVAGPDKTGSNKPGQDKKTNKSDPTQVDTNGTTSQLAKRILNSDRISLLPRNISGVPDGADARSNIKAAAEGRQAKRSSYKGAPGGHTKLSPKLLKGMLELSKKYKFRVTSIAGGSHSKNSRHYNGVAFDVDRINGRPVGKSNPYWRAFMRDARKLGATELLGPGHRGHSRHLHISWPRGS